MKIGLTYDLREDYRTLGFSEAQVAEFDCLETIEAIEAAIQGFGHQTERIGNVGALVLKLSQGKRWDLVFNIAEGLHGYGREAQIPALLDAYQIPYTFSDPLALCLTLHKGMCKRVARDLGIRTPGFAVIESVDSQCFDSLRSLKFPLFAKPVAEGTSKGVSAKSVLGNIDEAASVCRDLLTEFRQPVLVEEFLPGREYTVGVLGTGASVRVLGALEVIPRENSEQSSYSYLNKKNWAECIEYRLVDDLNVLRSCANLARAVWMGFGCRDAGRVDLREDREGNPSFLEVNPLAGLNPEYSDLPILCSKLEMSYENLIGSILLSAQERIGAMCSVKPSAAG